MRILFFSGELIGSALCLRFLREGHDVKLYIDDITRKNCLEGIVTKVNDWKKELKWVGKDGLIVFDDVGFGKIQEDLRKKGYQVFGGNKAGDTLELDRGYAQKVLEEYKIKILPSFDFENIDAAIEFIKKNKGKWVVKQNSHISVLNHVGVKEDGSDVIDILKTYKKLKISSVHLQKKADGVEVGVARYFNGKDWVGPIEINHEHKNLKNDDKGPLTAEMGTVIWHTYDEELPLFKHTLKKLTAYLRKIDYRGDIDINCIVEKDAVWPLELTPRLGSPSTQLHCELYQSSMAEFILAVASGKKVKLKYKTGFGIVLPLAVPPFPYPPNFGSKKIKKNNVVIKIDENLKLEDLNSIYLEEVSLRRKALFSHELYWAGEFGYVAYLTASAETIKKTQAKLKKLLPAIRFDDMIYRTDIGNRVNKNDLPKLKKWGWI